MSVVSALTTLTAQQLTPFYNGLTPLVAQRSTAARCCGTLVQLVLEGRSSGRSSTVCSGLLVLRSGPPTTLEEVGITTVTTDQEDQPGRCVPGFISFIHNLAMTPLLTSSMQLLFQADATMPLRLKVLQATRHTSTRRNARRNELRQRTKTAASA